MTLEKSLFSDDGPSVSEVVCELKEEFQNRFDKGDEKIQAEIEEHKFALMDLLDALESESSGSDLDSLRQDWERRTKARSRAEKWLEDHSEAISLILQGEAIKIEIHSPLVSPFWKQFETLKSRQWETKYKALRELRGNSQDMPFFAAEQEHEST